jgi:hypothetical protein
MSTRNAYRLAGASALVLILGACGGGVGGGVASIPPPPPSPTPTPTPSPTPTPTPVPAIPAGPIGLTGAASFAAYSAYKDASGRLVSGPGGVEFSYSAADDSYTVKLPGFDQGKLVTAGGNGSFNADGWIHLVSTFNNVTRGNSSDLQPVNVDLDWPASSDLKYTSFAAWFASSGDLAGVFAYGIPTAAGDVPLTGSASYDGEIRGLTANRDMVFGSIDFSFDFGAGTLSGEMSPIYAPVWDSIGLGTYTFKDTVYSTGSTSFSGSFDVPAGADGASSFQGSFTGPGAAELMGSWTAPYKDPVNGTQGTMSGVFGGKKGP